MTAGLYNEKINIDEELLKNNLVEQTNVQSNEIDEFLLYEIIFSGNSSAELKNKYNNIGKMDSHFTKKIKD